MSDAESGSSREVEEVESKKPDVDAGSNDEGAGESGDEKVEVNYDPSAKPAKGILKKPGEESGHKSESHIHLAAGNDEGEHDAENKKSPKKPMPVEGRTGVVMGGKKKGSISSGSGAESSDNAPAEKKAEKPAKEPKPEAEAAKPEKESSKPEKSDKKKKKESDKAAAEGEDPEKCSVM